MEKIIDTLNIDRKKTENIFSTLDINGQFTKNRVKNLQDKVAILEKKSNLNI